MDSYARKTEIIAARKALKQQSCFWKWPWGHLWNDWHLISPRRGQRECQACPAIQWWDYGGWAHTCG